MRYQKFYWDEVYKEISFSSLEDFLVGFREGFFLDSSTIATLTAPHFLSRSKPT